MFIGAESPPVLLNYRHTVLSFGYRVGKHIKCMFPVLCKYQRYSGIGLQALQRFIPFSEKNVEDFSTGFTQINWTVHVHIALRLKGGGTQCYDPWILKLACTLRDFKDK